MSVWPLLGLLLTEIAVPGYPAAPAATSAAPPTAPIERLARVVGRDRPSPGRLTEGFAFAPETREKPALRLEAGAGSETFPQVAAAIEGAAYSSPLPADLQALGVLRLVERRPSDAVDALEASVSADPTSPVAVSDLAAAYLARGEALDQPSDDVLALEAADRALELDPGLAEPAFNRAVALERLGLVTQTTSAWESYLTLDRDSGWATEARRRRAALLEPDFRARFQEALPEIEATASRGDAATLQKLVDPFRELVRVRVEEGLIPDWAAAYLAGKAPEARRQLTLAHSLAEALYRLSGEAYGWDTVATIEAATGHPASLAALAKATWLLARAGSLYKNEGCGEAKPLSDEAVEKLTAAGSPARWAARLGRAICVAYEDPVAATSELDRLATELEDRPYFALRSQVAWMRGWVAMNRGDPSGAIRRYQQGLLLARKGGEDSAAAAFDLLLVAPYQRLGEPGEAWRHARRALRSLSRSGHRHYYHNILLDTTDILLRSGRITAASELAAEQVDNDKAWGSPGPMAEALYTRGRVAGLAGRWDEARNDFEEARHQAGEMDSADPRRHLLEANLDVELGVLLAERSPSSSVVSLSTALETLRTAGNEEKLPRLLLARARAYRRSGKTEQAEADLAAAIARIDRLRELPSDTAARISYFETVQATYDEMVDLELQVRGDADRALLYADRSRARALVDRVSSPAPASGTGSAATAEAAEAPEVSLSDRMRRELPEGVVLVEYSVLPDRVLIWAARRGAPLLSTECEVPRQEISARVTRLRRALERRATEGEIREAAASLHECLLAPIAEAVPERATLVFVPDRELNRLPFAALFDPREGRYLVEQHTVSVVPSAALFLDSESRAPAILREKPGLLAVGNPTLDRERFPDLPDLPGAEREVEGIAKEWPGTEVLGGTHATRRAVVEEMGTHGIVHLAAHALLNSADPSLSLLALSPGRDEDTGGALFARDIAALHLSGTSLVFLSSCRSVGEFPGAGREGLSGLARAFLEAGVPAVVANLWEVDDRTAAVAAVGFYRFLAGGETVAEALRHAQLAMLRGSDPEVSSPAAWAALTLVGFGQLHLAGGDRVTGASTRSEDEGPRAPDGKT